MPATAQHPAQSDNLYNAVSIAAKAPSDLPVASRFQEFRGYPKCPARGARTVTDRVALSATEALPWPAMKLGMFGAPRLARMSLRRT
jgi:hypothetical protein